MGRDIYGRCSTPDPIPPITSTPLPGTSGSGMCDQDISPTVDSESDRERRAFLNCLMPGFDQTFVPELGLTHLQAFYFMEEHSRYQSIIDLIKQGIQDIIVSEILFSASSSEELFIVMFALRDLEVFMGAAAMQNALRSMPRNDLSVEAQRWSVPFVKPAAWMYPTLEHPRIKDQLEAILLCAEDIGKLFD